MEQTGNLQLPYIMPSQAQKHVTHNEALDRLDAVVQLAVLDRHLTNPAANAQPGDRHIVAAGATGAWQGQDGKVAAWLDGTWTFFAPRLGWLCFVADETALVFWDGAQWKALAGSGASLQNVPLLGIGAQAEAANPLLARLNSALLAARPVADGGSGDLRVNLNKEGTAGTASHIYQSGFSGRAETGLTGNEDFTVKVSADGSSWREAIVADRESGTVRFPHTNVLTEHALNLLQDSGRFAAGAATSITVGAFVFPSYLSLLNGSTVSAYGKFVHDNGDYGGSAGALQSEVRSLIDQIRDPAFRRYGIEFWVAQVTMGSGTSSSLVRGGETFYASLRNQQGPRLPAMSFHGYFRALDDNILIRRDSGQTITRGGVQLADYCVITPSDGWISIGIADLLDVRRSSGYAPDILGVSVKAQGHRWLLACPAIMAGLTRVDPDAGVIASFNRWPVA